MTGNSVTDLPATPQCDSENGCQTREGSCLKQSTSEQVSVCLSNDKSISKCQTASQSIQNELPATPQCDSGNGCQAGEDSCLRQSASEQVSGCLSNDKSVSEFQLASQNIPNEPAATTQCDSVNGYQTGEDSCQQSASEQVSGCLANGKSISEFQSAAQNIPNEPAATAQCDSGIGCQTGERSCLKQSASEQVSGCFANDKSINDCQLASQNIQNELDATPQCDSGNGCQTREGSCLKQSASEQVSGCFSNDKSINEFQPTSLDVQNEPAVTTQCDSRNGCQTGEGSCLKQSASEQVSSFSANDKTTNEFQPASQNIQNELAATSQCDSGNACQTGEGSYPEQSASEQVSGCLFNNKSINKFQLASQSIQNDRVEVNAAVINFLDKDQMQSVPAQLTMSTGNKQLDPPSGDVAKSSSFDCFERKSEKEIHARVGHRKKLTSKSLKKYMLRSLGSNDRALRSKTREKTKSPESNTNLVNARNDGEKSSRGKKKKKKKSQGEGVADEFSRIRAHLKYLLNRVSYEQSLIDAYSGEGWKGNSMDKLKPEKELQRAKSEILRRKLKFRDLFRHLDTLCTEGKLPESLFDSEGEIDSEDIFCAKCGSKDLTTENDIILCDGPCDRGFHQFCLEPPLLTENIPPDNESWLCPGCDCKDDCIELLNESFGTSLSISDTWERIFPEAAATAGNNVGLPSEDSDDDDDDDDYNPDIPEDKEMKRDESNSDESEYASASEKLDDPRKGDPYLGLPSDDSEDDDYDPNSPNLDKKVTEESSSSDFTSDSEDLEATVKDSMLSGEDEDPVSASSDVKQFKGSGRQRCKAGKRQTLADELSSLIESDPGQEGSAPVSGKRQGERLDYKKLYDETYKNMESDTSDDEDWTDTATASRRKKLSTKVTPASSNGKALTEDHVQDKSERTPKRNTSQNKVENTRDTPLEGSRKSSCSDKKPGSSTYKRLGDAVVQRLNNSFEENKYPDRATKENLAQELGLTFQQVDKWFGNTRWSFRHPSHTKVIADRNDASEQATCSKAENQESLVEEKGNCGEKSKSSSRRKRKRESDPEASDANFDVDNAATQPQTGSSGAQKGQRGHKMRKRRR